jgi:hypothetical protein
VLGGEIDFLVAGQRARMELSRPTTNGVIMCGKMTTSRMGIIGNVRVSLFSLPENIGVGINRLFPASWS